MYCSAISHMPEPKSSSSSAATAGPLPQAVRGFGGLGLLGVRDKVPRMQAPPPPAVPPHGRTWRRPWCCRRPRPRTVQRRRGPRAGEPQGRGRWAMSRQIKGRGGLGWARGGEVRASCRGNGGS